MEPPLLQVMTRDWPPLSRNTAGTSGPLTHFRVSHHRHVGIDDEEGSFER